MIDDPIVEDVYQARQRILDQCDGDLTRWIERLKAAEWQHRNQVVTLEEVRNKRRDLEGRHPA
jgi:succinate dehydrogenase flavin-adding protein (antitoxin of CptAB toxin-antitoxin module)